MINNNTKWIQKGVTVSAGNGHGSGINQLHNPHGLCLDHDDQTLYFADRDNNRIVEWKYNERTGRVVAGENAQGNGSNQLSQPIDVIIDEMNDSLIISDHGNQRVVRWPLHNGQQGQTIISDARCFGLTMDDYGSLYVVDFNRHEVKRYRMGESEGTVVAGGNGPGSRLDQLSYPTYVCVDQDHSVFVSDSGNDRVMKWMKNNKEGKIVAGGQGAGNLLAQLSGPHGVIVDQSGNVYVADYGNHRIMRWNEGANEGSVIIAGNGQGNQPNQLHCPVSLSFDREGNVYVTDVGNHWIQKFMIDRS